MLCGQHQSFKRPVVPAGVKFKHLDRLYAATDYHQLNSQKLVQFLKFYGHRYTTNIMAQQLLEQVPAQVWAEATVIPLPLHWTRRWQRGFNQSALLAQNLQVKQPSLKIQSQDFKRVRLTKQQARLSRAERLKNMQHAFAWNGPTKPPASVILLDDVSTTGSTLEAAAQALKAAGAKQVTGVVFAYQSLG